MKRHIGLGSLLFLIACGGGAAEKPPETPKDPPLTEPAKPAPTGGSSEGPAAKSTSDDVTKGVSALKAGDMNAARASFEAAIKKNPKQADAHYYLGLVMDKAGERAAAETEYKEALTLQPDLLEAAENLVAIQVEGQKFDDAIAVAKKALAKNPKAADLTLNYAIALAGKGDQEAAQKAFEDAVKFAPNDARFYLAHAQQLAVWKKQDAAIGKLKEAQRVAGEDAALVGSIGFELRQLRAVPECIAAFDKAIGLKDNADFRTNRALCKMAGKDRPGALADLKEATTKEPGFALAHYWYGLLQHEDGKFTEAAAEYEAYLKAAPKGPAAKAATEKLKLAKDKKKPGKGP